MINLYTGTPGSGKSVHQAQSVYYGNIARKGIIVNYDIRKDLLRHPDNVLCVDNADLSPALLYDYADRWWSEHDFREGGIRLYLDECQLIFNARSWAERGRAEWIKFFTQHRKLGYDVYLCCQFDSMLDKQIRSLVEYQYVHRTFQRFGFAGDLANVFSFGHPLICAVRMWYPLKARLGAEWLIGRRKWYRLYDTRNLFG